MKNLHKKLICFLPLIFIVELCYTQSEYLQTWFYSERESFDGYSYFAIISKPPVDTAQLTVEKTNGEISFYLIGARKIGGWCKIQIRFSGEQGHYESSVQSVFGGYTWDIIRPTTELTNTDMDIIEKLRIKDYIFLKVFCYEGIDAPLYPSTQKEYKFNLIGSNAAISKVLNK